MPNSLLGLSKQLNYSAANPSVEEFEVDPFERWSFYRGGVGFIKWEFNKIKVCTTVMIPTVMITVRANLHAVFRLAT